MSIHKTDAVILSRVPVRETSLITTLFTRDFGKIKGQLKGMHAEHGKFASTLQSFSLNQIVFYKSRHSEFNLISQCDLSDNFNNIRMGLEATYAAYFLIELTNTLMQNEDAHPDIFDFLVECLRVMDNGSQPQKISVIFQIKMLNICGFKPHFDSCVSCLTALDDRAFFSLSMGGMLCRKCLHRDAEARPIYKGTISTILHIEKNGLQDNLRITLTGKVKEELSLMLRSFLDFHLDRELRSRRFIEQGVMA
ncbi:MAG: DNA repair protein RecO [Candidatus Omnitrophica bacterium]|nr:DNA repair protein RecO [Candidatus Omnitrophota bacterium]